MKPFSRKGLHRVECPACPGYAYSTVAELEARGLPSCACGERYEPGRVELAMLLGVDCAATAELDAKCSSVAHGQAWNGGDGYRDPTLVAIEHVELERQAVCRTRRLAGIGLAEIVVEREVPAKHGGMKTIKDAVVYRVATEAMAF